VTYAPKPEKKCESVYHLSLGFKFQTTHSIIQVNNFVSNIYWKN